MNQCALFLCLVEIGPDSWVEDANMELNDKIVNDDDDAIADDADRQRTNFDQKSSYKPLAQMSWKHTNKNRKEKE